MDILRSLPILKDCGRFITMPNEKLLYAQRKHWIVLFAPYVLLIFSSIALIAVTFLLSRLISDVILITLALLFILTILAFGLIKIYIDWYYQLYIITTRKIVEVDSFPLFSHVINDLLLDQVRITEIDIETHGLMYQLFDIGTVKIDYDRYSHGGVFALNNIKDPDQAGQVLSYALGTIMQNTQQDYTLRRQIESLRSTTNLFTNSLRSIKS